MFNRSNDGHLKRRRKTTWDEDPDRGKKWITVTALQKRNGSRLIIICFLYVIRMELQFTHHIHCLYYLSLD
jgi:hypothetical protein